MNTEICDTATYYLRVYALEENPQFKYEVETQIDSSESSLSCLTNTISELPIIGAFRFYPNPVQDVLNIDLREIPPIRPGSSFLSLYNTQGKLVSRQEVEEEVFQWQIPSLAEGMYLIELQTDREVFLKKLLINTP